MKHLYLFLFLIFSGISVVSFGQFGPQNIITGQTDGIESVYACDIDGDGDNDLITASYGDKKIAWYENTDGVGSFGPQQIISIFAAGALSVYACDIDGDSDIDVLSASISDDKIAWYENIDGNGVFGVQQIINDSADGAWSVYACDIDGDGDNDVLSASSIDNEIVWYENTSGNGNFGSKQIISTNVSDARSVYACDIDGDGDNDVLSASRSDSKIAWYENTDGVGTFGNQIIICASAFGAYFVFACDIDGDGDNDVLWVSDTEDKVVWHENTDSGGSFGPEQIITTIADGARSAYACDIDGDTDIDVLSASYNDSKIAWYENTDGSGTFGTQQIIAGSTIGASSVYSCDIDGDGDSDVIAGSISDSKLAWYNNTSGNGTFGPQQIIITNAFMASSIFSCDIDGDGDNDVLTASEGDNIIAYYENLDGNGIFSTRQIICDSGYYYKSIYACDIDSDGDNDVLSASYFNGVIAWHENINGLGAFGVQQIINDSADGAWSVYACDIDGDGDNDVLSSSSGSSTTIAWYENTDGYGDFGNQHAISSLTIGEVKVFASDIDGDGDNDVLSSSYNDNKIAWYENTDGNGNFGSQQIISLIANRPKSVYSCDIDNDGDNDVLSASWSDNKIAWYENTDGTGTFGAQQIISLSAECATSVFSCDIDDDGDNDVLSASEWDNKIAWYENIDGNGNFGSQQVITLTANYAQSVFASDIDGDGDNDVLSASSQDGKIAWYENFIYNAPYKIEGMCFHDENQNGQKDSLENGLCFIQTELNPNELASFLNSTGEFWFATDTGAYILTYNNVNYWGLTTDSSAFHVILTSSNPLVDSLYFGFYPDTIITEIITSLTSGQQGCDNNVNYWINYINFGTTEPIGVVELILDSQITYISSTITPDSIIGQNIYWSFDTLNYFAEGMIPLVVHTPDFNSVGDTLTSIVNIYTTDITGLHLFTDTLFEILTCSYDPNDKLVSPTGTGLEGIISKDEILEYTVRFQNTGNDTAINVKIRDQIDPNIDISSIQLLGTSHHSVDVYIEQNRWLVIQFDSIMLPDSTTNFIESQGFVKYRMAIDSTVLPNTKIQNNANIFFDCNPAVVTNNVLNTIECYISPLASDIYLSDTLLIASTSDNVQWYLNDTIIIGATDSAYYPLVDGNYTVLVTDSNGCSALSDVYIHNTVWISEIEQGLIINVYPNPFKDYTTVEFSESLKGEHDFVIYNLLGSEVKRYSAIKSNKLQIHKTNLTKGIYLGKLIDRRQKTTVGTVKLVID
ncbi:MAG: FG-GAP-like repeat-containing protein [Bacteroidota bacterium]